MPQMDGIELLRRIERADPSIEVVVITTEPTRSMETLLAHRFDWVPPGHGAPTAPRPARCTGTWSGA